MKKWLIVVCIALAGALAYTLKEMSSLNQKYETAVANMKAYDSQLGSEKQRCAAFQLTVNQLEYFQDSILKKLDETRNELKVKDKNLKALQYVASSFTRKDTIRITQVDTLFREPSLALDTIIGDSWYKLRLGLKYPSMIAVSPDFKSEKHIVVFTKKETVNPPKKFWLFRLFQKKHTVLNVEIKERNPYVQDETSKYVEIIR